MAGAITLALTLGTLACLALYLASPNQRWLARPWPARPSRTLATALLLVSLAVAAHAMQTVAAVFTLVVWAMLLLTLLPYLAAWRATRKEP